MPRVIQFLSSKIWKFDLPGQFFLTNTWAEGKEGPHTGGQSSITTKDAYCIRPKVIGGRCWRHHVLATLDNLVEGCSHGGPRKEGGLFISFYFGKKKRNTRTYL